MENIGTSSAIHLSIEGREYILIPKSEFIKPEPMEIEVWVHPSGDKNFVGGSLASPSAEWHCRTKDGYTKKKFREVLE